MQISCLLALLALAPSDPEPLAQATLVFSLSPLAEEQLNKLSRVVPRSEVNGLAEGSRFKLREYEGRLFFIDERILDLTWVKQRLSMIESVRRQIDKNRARVRSQDMDSDSREQIKSAFQQSSRNIGDEFEIMVSPTLYLNIQTDNVKRQVVLHSQLDREALYEMAKDPLPFKGDSAKKPSEPSSYSPGVTSWHAYYLSVSRSDKWRRKALADVQEIIAKETGPEIERLQVAFDALVSMMTEGFDGLKSGMAGGDIKGELRELVLRRIQADLGITDRGAAEDLLNRSNISIGEVMLSMTFSTRKPQGGLSSGTIPLSIGPDR